ncbi:MAG TPA: M43 family zinc metalloprotease [Candidatus Nitrosocosmicus sp.]
MFYLVHDYVTAQNICASEMIFKERILNDHSYKKFIDSFNNALHINGKLTQRFDTAFLNIIDTIPLVVHIVHNGDAIGSRTNPSDQKIIDLIDSTNKHFSDVGIHFMLAQRDEQCNSTTGIDRIDGRILPDYNKYGINYNKGLGASIYDLMNLIKWDHYRYYNIWIVTSIDEGNYLGFAYYPGDQYDGAVISNSAISAQSKVLAHELGHAFFLFHTFQGSSSSACSLNNDCTADGDMICDTDPETEASYPREGINPCTNTVYSDNTERNIMSYSDEEIFTNDQKIRMQAALRLPARDTLSKSLGKYKPDQILSCDLTLHLNGELRNNDVFLNWKYGTTLPKERIWVERSYDGFHFKDLNYVLPITNKEEYTFQDYDISQENNYYRLMQTLADGTQRYSNTVQINNTIKYSNSFIVLGNPIHNNQIELEFGQLEQHPSLFSDFTKFNAEIDIIDAIGKVLFRSYPTIFSFERYRIQLSNVPTGIYFIKLLVNNSIYVKKVIKY